MKIKRIKNTITIGPTRRVYRMERPIGMRTYVDIAAFRHTEGRAEIAQQLRQVRRALARRLAELRHAELLDAVAEARRPSFPATVKVPRGLAVDLAMFLLAIANSDSPDADAALQFHNKFHDCVWPE